jgi:ATP-dependent helicase/nuclease subunit A
MRMSSQNRTAPPDQNQRERALDPHRSVLVQAPAGSGKTDLLTRRFLRLLSDVDDPAHIVAITFTKAAAAEMRHRIVAEIEKAALRDTPSSDDELSMEALARRALDRSHALGWNLIDLPGQLRISTIDSFCRELALQQPLLSGLGGGIDIAEQPTELYRRAARRTLERLGSLDQTAGPSRVRKSIETLLLWRDNNWQDLENQLVEMLRQRDRWMQDFVLDSEQDWDALRVRLERPFLRAVGDALAELARLIGQHPGACDEAMDLVRFCCEHSEDNRYRELAELAEFPCGPFLDAESIEEARQAYASLADLLLIKGGAFRQSVNKSQGFPSGYRSEKNRFLQLTADLANIDGLREALAAVKRLPALRYTEDGWIIVRACFTLLRHAAGELRVVFAESGAVDYVEVAQLAQRILEGQEGVPTDAALAIADEIRHLLVDEFQDTSRRQHQLIAGLVAAWPDTAGRTAFVVGDPMQSIYFFRDADAELFPRVRDLGLELPTGESHQFGFAPLASNFRTEPQLVERLNDIFGKVFATNDGSQVRFSPSEPVRSSKPGQEPNLTLDLEFVPQTVRTFNSDPDARRVKEAAAESRALALKSQTSKVVSLIRKRLKRMERARRKGDKYRIAVLGRTRAALTPIAETLRNANIPFRAVDLEPLAERQEVLDVLALARAFLNEEDRVAWLGMLRAPWCGLSLKDLYTLTAGDDPESLRIPIARLLAQRAHLLSNYGQRTVDRVIRAFSDARSLRSSFPSMSVGTWLKTIWERVGGAGCVNETELANLKLLWKCLDALPGGEPDLLGIVLPTALESLTALPDPAATSEHGVQLMTIHKSKGLEFEVVIVPELQAGANRTTTRMLTWLERGIAAPDESGAITEFLIAPVQPKGEDRGEAKKWVDRALRERERQEIRRILYVAATRAREELHLFARPEYKQSSFGEPILRKPRESLLSSAWPALQDEVQRQFETWKRERAAAEVVSLAAAGDNNAIQMSLPFSLSIHKPAVVRRLPLDYQVPDAAKWRAPLQTDVAGGGPDDSLYQRHEGSSESRALGSAVHAYFEELARLTMTLNWDAVREAVTGAGSRIAAQIRALGIAQPHAERIAAQALEIALRASRDSTANWILAPHVDARSEARWAGVIAGGLRTVQVDRVFRAGSAPHAQGEDTWWIVDYKTAHAEGLDPESALADLRPLFAPQLETYAQVLRNLHGMEARIHAGLYYPRMLRFDWWEI